eukprot:scaffold6485_cov29-Cyclotella_meneghiniana.AAC.1
MSRDVVISTIFRDHMYQCGDRRSQQQEQVIMSKGLLLLCGCYGTLVVLASGLSVDAQSLGDDWLEEVAVAVAVDFGFYELGWHGG